MLIEPQDLRGQAEDPRLLLIDCRDPEAYKKGHLRGAVNLPPSSMEWSVRLADGNEIHHLLAPVERVAPLLSYSGIHRESRIVIYDDGTGYTAARVYWILDYLAHPNPGILNGGLPAWQSVGGDLSTVEPLRPRGDFIPDPDPARIADFQSVNSLLEHDGVLLLNSLPRKNFQKEAIPGSINMPYTEIYRAGKSRHLLDPQHLADLFLGASISPEQELILYCGIGYTASLLYLAARLLGYPRVRLYDGSLADWKARGGKLLPG